MASKAKMIAPAAKISGLVPVFLAEPADLADWEAVWHDICDMSGMRRRKKYYQVEIEVTGFVKRFECLEEACEYAEQLFRELEREILVVEVDPEAPTIYEKYTPIFLYDGITGEIKSFRE
jgi:hypothetical protein